MIEIPMRYKVKFAKMTNKLIYSQKELACEKKKTQIRNIKNAR